MSYPVSALSGAFNRAPASAVKYLSSKVSKGSFNWWETLESSHEKAFVVAKASQADVLDSIRSSLQKSQKNGETFSKFQKDLEPTLRRLGWWGKTKSGETLGTPYRLKNIFSTNIQQSFNAGREKSIRNRSDLRPFAEYLAILDSKTRPTHGRLNGIVCPVNDPFWSYYTPSNGYRCRCRKRSLSKRAVERRELSPESFEGRIGYEDQFVNKSKGITKRVATININGTIVSPDPGFSSNPLSKYTPSLKDRPPQIKAALKKDLDKAKEEGKRKARERASFDRSKKTIKNKSKPKTFNESLKKSEELLSTWTKDFEKLKVDREGKTDVFNFPGGNMVSVGNIELANKLSKALKKRSFRGQAKAINEARKGVIDPGQISSIDRFSEELAKNIRKSQKAIVDKAIPPFKDISFGAKTRISEDLFPKISGAEKDFLLDFKKMKSATEQVENLNSGLAKTVLSKRIRLSLLSQIEDKIEDFVQASGNFLGGGLQNSNLPAKLNPSLMTAKVTKSAAEGLGIGAARKEFKRRSNRAAQFYKKNLSSEMYVEDAISGYSIRRGGGSSYNPGTNKITLDFNQDTDTFIHEMGHHFHDKNPRIGRMIEEFFRLRCKGEKISSSSNYSKNVSFLRDNFSDPYIGRVYGGELPSFKSSSGIFDFDKYLKNPIGKRFQLGTETFTRGIQYFFKDKASFYAKDPEFYELILSILRGEIPE